LILIDTTYQVFLPSLRLPSHTSCYFTLSNFQTAGGIMTSRSKVGRGRRARDRKDKDNRGGREGSNQEGGGQKALDEQQALRASE